MIRQLLVTLSLLTLSISEVNAAIFCLPSKTDGFEKIVKSVKPSKKSTPNKIVKFKKPKLEDISLCDEKNKVVKSDQECFFIDTGVPQAASIPKIPEIKEGNLVIGLIAMFGIVCLCYAERNYHNKE